MTSDHAHSGAAYRHGSVQQLPVPPIDTRYVDTGSSQWFRAYEVSTKAASVSPVVWILRYTTGMNFTIYVQETRHII